MKHSEKQIGIGIETETLSDGSKVYNLIIGGESFPCLSEKHALEAYETISNALEDVALLLTERDCLTERLRQTPTVREIVGELREIADCLNDHRNHSRRNLGREHLNALLRRLDVES